MEGEFPQLAKAKGSRNAVHTLNTLFLTRHAIPRRYDHRVLAM